MLAIGGAGLMNAVGNLAPTPVNRLCEAVAADDLATARRLHYALFTLNRAVFWDTNPIPIKYFMKRLGLLHDNEHRLPTLRPDAALCARLDSLLPQLRPMAEERPPTP
ncbi:hypothetical protein GCM10010411_87760 [Actinomadura fulvescens]|uniref:Dihydrodipicolinate synthase n=2 Tax=Actinomadura fulvescens TaxID=46160 RepID=A0ABN3QUM5_9ACTN